MPKPATPSYRTTNWSEYNAALKQRGSLEIRLDPGMQWLSTARGGPGRPMRFTDSAIEVCLTLKAVFGLALRQVTGLVASLLKLAKLDWPVPDYVTCSMSRSGNVWDNAAMESFFSSMKTERIDRKTYRMRTHAKADVFDYIERFYNPTRRHSTLGYLSPMDFGRRAQVA